MFRQAGEKMTETRAKPIRKILVVEDSRTQAEYLRHILENEGYRVTLAENGTEALGQITIDPPSLVFTDVVMPEMDGYELCRRIKEDERTRSIPVILVTQLFDPVDVIRGLESGADDFIIKPFEAGYLRSRISTILSAMERPDPDGLLPGLPVVFGEKTYNVASSRIRIFNILLSTYEVAVSKNAELLEVQDRLNGLNEQLRQAVEDLKKSNHNLEQENLERRRVEKALDEANRKLNLMASITRHDILNQLTTQHEYLESALAQKDRNTVVAWTQVASAKTITDQTINAIRFTGDYQKIGIKAPIWQDLRTLIEGAIQATPTGAVAVENSVPENVQIYADPLISKIFTNLIENAIKYGKTITALRFSLSDLDGTRIIICQDNGIGIPPENKDKIFSYEYGMNTSMGLFLSREILALTGISITENGEFQKGARFAISCPPSTIRRT
jgi:DNA-binding response OmpR family regulator